MLVVCRSIEQKRQMVQETLEPGASVAVIARRHGINANCRSPGDASIDAGFWSVDACNAEESTLVPVTLGEIEAPQDHPIGVASEPENAGRIDIQFSGGGRARTMTAGP
jgi:transposase